MGLFRFHGVGRFAKFRQCGGAGTAPTTLAANTDSTNANPGACTSAWAISLIGKNEITWHFAHWLGACCELHCHHWCFRSVSLISFPPHACFALSLLRIRPKRTLPIGGKKFHRSSAALLRAVLIRSCRPRHSGLANQVPCAALMSPA